MILEDFHVHTTYCDGKNSPEEMVRAAIDLKMTRLGFSVHSYTDFDESFCIKKDKIADYKAEIRGFAKKYKDKIQILCGVEQEYFSEEPTDGFDYVIGSVHYVKKAGEFFDVDNTPEIFVNGVNKHYNGDFSACAEDYFACVGDVVRKTGADIIGHFDLITKFNQDNCLFDTENPRYMAAAKKAVDSLLSCGKPFEVNTGAISRGWRKEAYPEAWILKYIAQMGGRIVLSSDSHSAQTLCYRFEEYQQLVKELGFDNLSF